jgi:serine/threonine-protein kinase HipA
MLVGHRPVPATKSLAVYYRDTLVGTLDLTAAGLMVFEYAAHWRDDPNAFPISQSIPLTGEYQRSTVDHAFFSNLLPEAEVRATVCRYYGISLSNDFELLRKIGGECAGALSLYEEGTLPSSAGSYRTISAAELKEKARTRLSRFIPDGRMRFSLAGGQDKWPVYYKDEQIALPEGGYPSTHILKFDSLEYKGTGANEAFTSFLAGKLGLPVVKVEPHQGYTLTQRYDRRESADGVVARLHQEDFCQALGKPASQKYEAEGGPSFSHCYKLVLEKSSVPAVDTMHLLRWQIANVLLGNADGHAKNLSLLYDAGRCRLAPFYDLVCTNIYQGISHELAMAVGGERDHGHVQRKNWEQLAEELGIKSGIVIRMLDEMSAKLVKKLDDFTREYIEMNGEGPAIDRVRVHVRDQVRRTRTISFDKGTSER